MPRRNLISIYLVISVLSGMLLMGQTTGAVAADCVDFEDPPLSPPDYYVGGSFVDSGSHVTGTDFQWIGGTWTSGGAASIVLVGSFCEAGGSAQELLTNNINAKIDFPEVLTKGLTLRFAEQGGNVNIGINGVHTNVEDFSAIHGTTIAGVRVTCTGPGCAGGGAGELKLEGSIEEFYIGGQEFCIDDVCPIGSGGCAASPAEASTFNANPVYGSSDLAKHFAFFLLPIGAVIGLRIRRRKK